MKNLLTVSHLQASYGAAQILFDVSFDVKEGQVVTLLGRNGMGRSTVVKSLLGMLPSRKGVMTFNNERIDNLRSYKIAQMGIGLVPEGRQVFPNLTVEENLIATARPGVATKNIEPWTIERVYRFFPRLKERSSNMGNQLSGGEQQMLAIGRALMTNPKLVILDEATEGLAPIVRSEIWSALGELKSNGLSLIVIDKNLKPLLKLADKHFVIEKGRIVWSGDSPSLRSNTHVIHQFLGV